MTYVRRTRRGRRGGRSVANWFRARMVGLAFLAFAVIIISAVTYLTSVIPSNYIYVNGSTLGVGTTLPSGATGVDSKLFIGLLGWGVGIFTFIAAIKKLGLKI